MTEPHDVHDARHYLPVDLQQHRVRTVNCFMNTRTDHNWINGPSHLPALGLPTRNSLRFAAVGPCGSQDTHLTQRDLLFRPHLSVQFIFLWMFMDLFLRSRTINRDSQFPVKARRGSGPPLRRRGNHSLGLVIICNLSSWKALVVIRAVLCLLICSLTRTECQTY